MHHQRGAHAFRDVETVVVGGGAMGAAATWQLARRGRSVALLEQFGPGHSKGASHGASRNFNAAYSHPSYVDLLVEARTQWHELEAESGQRLLTQVGIVNHGPNADFDSIAEALTHAGFGVEFFAPGDAERQWPGFRFDGRVLFSPDSGRLDGEAALRALSTAAASLGADLRYNCPVVGITVIDDDLVRVDTEFGVILARNVIVAAGAWTQKLLGSIVELPQLRVTQEQPAHFALMDSSPAAHDAATRSWPGFNHSYNPGDPRYGYWRSAIYGMYTPGLGIKAGWHGAGPEVDPDHRDYLPEPGALADLRRYVAEWIPGANADHFDAISCTYTSTVDENFILDRVGPLVIAAGFSGHGFKFTPAIGRVLADLATTTVRAPTIFSLSQ